MIDSSNNNRFLIIVGIATAIGSAVPVGYNIGVINNPASYIRDWCNQTLLQQYNVNLTESSLDTLYQFFVQIFVIGAAIGSIAGGWVAGKFGRKVALLITSLLYIIGSILFIFCRNANSVEMLLIGRLIVGVASGLCTTILPLYLTELAPLKLRGAFGSCAVVGLTSGIVISQLISLSNVFGTETLWHYALSAYIVLVIICYAPSYYYPESPKYLYIVRGDREAARMVLYRLRGDNLQAIEQELNEMETYKNTTTQNSSFFAVLRDPALMMPLIIVTAYMGGQQLSGINSIVYYPSSTFKKVGIPDEDIEWANLGAGCINLIASLFSPILMLKFNRRPLMLLSCGADAILLFALTIITYYINSASWIPNVGIIVIFLYLIFFQVALGSLPWFIGSEIFKTESQPVAMSIGNISLWSCHFIIGMAFPSLQTALGAFVFLPFSITCVLLFILTKLYLPETRNRNPSEVAPLIANGFRSKPLQLN